MNGGLDVWVKYIPAFMDEGLHGFNGLVWFESLLAYDSCSNDTFDHFGLKIIFLDIFLNILSLILIS